MGQPRYPDTRPQALLGKPQPRPLWKGSGIWSPPRMGTEGRSQRWAEPRGLPDPTASSSAVHQSCCSPHELCGDCIVFPPQWEHCGGRASPSTSSLIPLARDFGCIRAHERGVTQGRCCLHLKSLAGTAYVGSGVLSATAGGVEAFSRTLSFKLSPALLRRCRRLLMLGSAVCCPAGAERGCRMQQEVACPSPALIPTPGVTPL